MAVRIGKMEGAGPYYGIPLDKLHLEWSPEEELEIERYCEKILKNVAEEEINPKERFRATIEGKTRDRESMGCWFFPLYAIRTLDSAADALKPIDNYRYPKLLVKSHLATVARFKLDQLNIDAIGYGEEIWGANAKMIEYGNPVVDGDLPVKSVADLEGLEVADPMKHGMFPQYLWFGKEVRRIFTKYGLDKVIPITMSFCPGPDASALMHMVGWAPYMISLRKNPELCKRATALGAEWSIKYGKAIAEEVKPDAMFYCNTIGALPIKGNEWIVEYYAKVGKALAPFDIPMFLGFAFNGCIEWLPALWEKGAVGANGFCGFGSTGDVNYKPLIDFAREHNLFCTCALSDKILLSGPVSLIEEEIKKRCEYAKPYLKYSAAIGSVDYWTPHAHLDAAVAACKKYGKF